MNTKRILALVLALCVVFSLALPGVAFADGDVADPNAVENNQDETTQNTQDQGTTYYTVSFDANGGVETYETQSVKAGDKAVKPSDPTQDGFTFDAWYEATRDEGNGEVYYSKYDFELPVNDNLELVALWNSTIPEEELNVVLTKQVRSLSLGNHVLTNNQSQDNNVAEVYNSDTLIGSYPTLADAIAATQDGYTVKLLANCETGSNYTITSPLVLSANNAKLDLNGKTLTVTSNFSFLISGNNTEVYGGTIQAGANSDKQTGINSYALVVNGCDGVKLYNLIVNGGISIGGSTGETPAAAAATNVTIENCTVISGDYYAVCAQQNSTVTIKSGTYTADTRSTYSGVIQGTFAGNDGPKGTVTVTGGTFNGKINNNDTGDIVLSGGTFDHDPSAYVADGYVVKPIEGDYSYVVEHTPVAKINETTYPTLAAAIEAAGNNESTITLVDNATGDVTVAAGQNITLDLNGHNIVGAQHAITNNGTLVITDTTDSGCVYTTDLSAQGMAAVLNEASGTLTINAGWFGDSDNDKTNANGVQRGNAVRNWGTATLNGGHYTACDNFTIGNGYAYAIGTGGTGKEGSMIIQNADVYGKMNGGIAADSGSLVVNGGSFVLTENKNYRALWITNDGGNTSVTVNGGTFIGKEAAVGASIDDNKQDSSNVAIVIKGGAFAAGNKDTVSVTTTNSKFEWTTQITGGIYKKAPAAKYIAPGYEVVSNPDPETSTEYPYAVIEHVHNFDYTKPNWSWKVVNGVWSATVSYPCTKGDGAYETVEAEMSGPVKDDGKYTYTATDPIDEHKIGEKANFDTKTVVLTFTVTYGTDERTFKYGEAFKAGTEGGTLYDWYVKEAGKTYTDDKGDLRAKGTSVFYLPVVANATVTRIDSAPGTTTQDPVANSSANATVTGEKGTVVYHVTWSLPEGAQITSEKIYRATSSIAKKGNVTVDLVKQYGNQHEINLNVRNGDYTYTINNLTPGKCLHIYLEIQYSLPDGGSGELRDFVHVDVSAS